MRPVRVYLVRHGEAASGWDGHLDPGLSPLGAEQAAAVADRLVPLGPLALVVSPLRRTRETAVPLAARWNVEPVIDERVAEIPSPTDDLEARHAWLHGVMASTWSDAAPELRPWCDEVVAALQERREDTVVVTHFVAINVAVGRANGDDRVVTTVPGYCSVTVLETDGESLRVIELDEPVTETVVQ